MKYALFFMLLAFSQLVIAQKPNNSSQIGNKVTSIDARLILGVWEATDSSKVRFEFVDSGYQIVLNPKSINRPYFFPKNKENNTVLSSGCYPNWPPFNCDLKLLDDGSLKISFSQLGATDYVVRCRKKHHLN